MPVAHGNSVSNSALRCLMSVSVYGFNGHYLSDVLQQRCKGTYLFWEMPHNFSDFNMIYSLATHHVYLPVYHVMFINTDGMTGQSEQELLF